MLRQQLALALPEWALQHQFDAVAYVPMHIKRLQQRGFNQSQPIGLHCGPTNWLAAAQSVPGSKLPDAPTRRERQAIRRAQLRRQFRLQAARSGAPTPRADLAGR